MTFLMNLPNISTHCKNLTFTDKPDYNYLKNLFIRLFRKHKYTMDFKYDWI